MPDQEKTEKQGSQHDSSTMEDFVFGGIESDDSILLGVERSRRQGIRHEHRIVPPDPGPAESVTLRVSVGPDILIDHICAYVTFNGARPSGARGVTQHGEVYPFDRVDVTWDPLVWDYIEHWEATIPGQPEGTLVHYTIEGWGSGEESSVWSRELTLDRVEVGRSLYGYHVDAHQPPAWAQDAVIYQIFVDRFARGPQGKAVAPGYLPAEDLEKWAGGDLAGITARIAYLSELGINAIWLTPIFLAGAYHGYDSIDYQEIDPRFGTKEDLRRLVERAHAKGIRVILDFVANHTSNQSERFLTAQTDQKSPYRTWFNFGDRFRHGYRTFFDVATMPQFDTDDPGARAYLIESARYWLEHFDVDGYRLDYAAGPSHSFWSEFRAGCRAAKPDCWLLGEVTLAGDQVRSYGGRLDGCLDFSFVRALRRLVLGKDRELAVSQFITHVVRSELFFPEAFSRHTFIENHDMNRFLWVVGQSEETLRFALALLFALGRSPILYYGTELGLSQPRPKRPYREESRHPMPWSRLDQNPDLLSYVKQLVQMRHAHKSARRGRFEATPLDGAAALWLVRRQLDEDSLWIVINGGDESANVHIAGSCRDALNQASISGPISLPPTSVRFLIPNSQDVSVSLG